MSLISRIAPGGGVSFVANLAIYILVW